MAKLSHGKAGDQVVVRGRPISFSYWPTYRTSRRYGLHSHVYSTNPWTLIHVSVRKTCPALARNEALASVEQAEFFYRSAVGAREWAAKPLPLYYSFMNLAKAFSLARGIRSTFDKAQHGLSEPAGSGGKGLPAACLESHPSPGAKGPNVFEDFRIALRAPAHTKKVTYQLQHLLPQVVPGHRLPWITSRPHIASGIVRTMERKPSISEKEADFRRFMKAVNANGGGLLFETMSTGEIDGFMDGCATEIADT